MEACEDSSYSKRRKVTTQRKETERECSAYWQQVDRESDNQGTAGHMDTWRQGWACRALPAGRKARNMSRGVCDCMRLVLRGRSSERNSSGEERQKECVRACEGM